MVADKASASSQEPPASQRVAFFDVVRGFSVISMVLFHLCYDLRYIYGFDLGFFQPPFQDIWRCSISWVFLFIAGCMCTFSRNGLKRSAKYLLAALTVYVVTVLAAVDTPISFGIIFCMGACTLVEYLLQRLHIAPSGLAAAAILLLAFLFTQGISHGYVGFGSMHVYLPKSLYATPYLSWLGFPGPGFASGDYYPVLPYCLMFLCGAAVARWWKVTGYPKIVQSLSFAPLEAVGRHALPIYLFHQPLIIAFIELFLI